MHVHVCVCVFLCRAAELVAARRTCCEALGAKFEAPLKEAVSFRRGLSVKCS